MRPANAKRVSGWTRASLWIVVIVAGGCVVPTEEELDDVEIEATEAP